MNNKIQINEKIYINIIKSPFDSHKEKPYLLDLCVGALQIRINELSAVDLEILGHSFLEAIKEK